MKYLNYFRYIIRHKYHVFIQCCKYSIVWRGIVHDLSKFGRAEFGAYTQKFFGNGQSTLFPRAWLHHIHHNEHHWQHWVIPEENKALEMPLPAIKEMLADWIAMGNTVGSSAQDYYLTNRNKIRLAENTRKQVEDLLQVSEFINRVTAVSKK